MGIEALKGKDKKARQEQLRLLERAYHGFANSNYSADVDKKIAKVMLKEYRSQVDPKAQPTYFELIDRSSKETQTDSSTICSRNPSSAVRIISINSSLVRLSKHWKTTR